MLKAMKRRGGRKRTIFAHHSLGIVSVGILVLWSILYSVSDPKTHWGSFCGNAIADWSGVVVMVIATKYLYERGSAESRNPPPTFSGSLRAKIIDHSLTLFLLATGLCWVMIFLHDNPESKWGQVVGNIVSEWTQIFALVIMTKRLVESRSKESKR
jgi:hypothetical protein